MVQLIGGEWVEVATLTIGEVTRTRRGEVCTQHLGDATSVEQATLFHRHRRGLERTAEVCAVHDGAEWLQGPGDVHRAAAHPRRCVCCRLSQRHRAGGSGIRLTHQGPARVLRHLRWLAARSPRSLMQEKGTSFQKREAHMPSISQHAGWPIGSGHVESAKMLVVEERLKDAGLRWQRQNVNPMLMLRKAVGHREWNGIWATSVAHRHTRRLQRRQATSQHQLERAWWVPVIWGARLSRLCLPSAALTTTAPAIEK